MGKIYLGSLFTIYAVSGEDADFGLLGVFPADRNAKQIIERVGDLMVVNLLPWMEEPELNGAWSRRAWTFQERALSQRHLLVGDGVIFNCLHTYSPEDDILLKKGQGATVPLRETVYSSRGTIETVKPIFLMNRGPSSTPMPS
jgi:hypothetical protein